MSKKEKIVKPPIPLSEPAYVKWSLISFTFVIVILFLVLPLFQVLHQALAKGFEVYFKAISDSEAWSAIRLTLVVAFFSVTFNTIFGVMAAWLITKFDFKGKSFLLSLIDLPFSVSPVISGLIFVLLFGAQSFLAPALNTLGIKVIFNTTGIIIATMFITFPFVVRELLPLMQEQGREMEEAALVLGANGWQTFWYVTLPNIRWGLIHGVILCNARAMGEFGAVSVVSGHIRGETNTIPLHVEILYNEYNFSAAFAVASLLALLGLVTLVIKSISESRQKNQIQQIKQEREQQL